MNEKTPRERIAEILEWTPEFLETMKNSIMGCICDMKPSDKVYKDKLDRLEELVLEARREGSEAVRDAVNEAVKKISDK